jgi:hypothetical protein
MSTDVSEVCAASIIRASYSPPWELEISQSMKMYTSVHVILIAYLADTVSIRCMELLLSVGLTVEPGYRQLGHYVSQLIVCIWQGFFCHHIHCVRIEALHMSCHFGLAVYWGKQWMEVVVDTTHDSFEGINLNMSTTVIFYSTCSAITSNKWCIKHTV